MKKHIKLKAKNLDKLPDSQLSLKDVQLSLMDVGPEGVKSVGYPWGQPCNHQQSVSIHD